MDDKKLAKANQIINDAEKIKTDKCSDEIEAVLRKYDRTMIPQIVHRGVQIIPQVLIVPITQNTPSPIRLQSLQEEGEQE